VSAPGRIARNAAIRSAGEVVAKLASLVFYAVMARKLGNEGFGDFMFALSLTSVLMLAAGFGVDDLTVRQVAREDSRAWWFLSNSAAVKVVTSLVLLGAAALAVNLLGYSSDAKLSVYLVGLGTAIETLAWSWHAIFAGRERLDLTAVAIILQRVVTAGVGTGVLLAGGGLVAASAIFLAGAVVGLAASHFLLVRTQGRPALEIDVASWRGLLKAAFPIGVVTLLLTALLRLDAVLLSVLQGGDNSDVGLFSGAYRLVEATMFIAWAFSHAALPWLGRAGRTPGPELARACGLGMKALALVLTPLAVLLGVLAEPIVKLFYGDGFADAASALRLLAPISILYGLNFFAASALIAADSPGRFRRVALAVLAFNVSLNLVLIPKLGADGAATSALASSLLLSLLAIWQITSLTGSLRLPAVFAGPLAGAGAATAAMVSLDLGLVAEAVIGLAVYTLVVAAVERSAFRDDFALAVSVLRSRRHPVPGPLPD
jgi:O-antigen/teichoic acid export membrane protein